MNSEDSARSRVLLANDRTLLAYVRTAISLAGLGFVVAKFGLSPKMSHVGGYLGILMVFAGLIIILTGFAQHRVVLLKAGPPPPGTSTPSRFGHTVAVASCALVCALLISYIAVYTI